MTALAKKCVAGKCTACGAQVWRQAMAVRNNGPRIKAGDVSILWPDPTSVYAKVEADNGFAPGIAFCERHIPAIGQEVLEGYGPVVEIETAHTRYASWYSDDHGRFRRLWLRDAYGYDQPAIDQLMSVWEQDRP